MSASAAERGALASLAFAVGQDLRFALPGWRLPGRAGRALGRGERRQLRDLARRRSQDCDAANGRTLTFFCIPRIALVGT